MYKRWGQSISGKSFTFQSISPLGFFLFMLTTILLNTEADYGLGHG